MLRKIVSIILVIIWLVLIFTFSNQDGTKSQGLSDKVSEFIIVTLTDIEPNTSEMEKYKDMLSYPVRKAAHLTEYFILGLLVFNMLNEFKMNKYMFIISIIICFICAGVDEIHQLFISDRTGKITDVLIDTSGSILANFILFRFYYLRRKYEKNNH